MQSGKLGYLESLRKAVVLIRELEVTSLDDLEQAAREGRVRGLKGFGEKTELLILEGIPKVRARRRAFCGQRSRAACAGTRRPTATSTSSQRAARRSR